MAKAKKSKPRDRLVRWRVSLMRKTPATFIDFAYAPDAQAAERRVAREHKISGTLRNRLVAIREDWWTSRQSGSPAGTASHEPETDGQRGSNRERERGQ
jgi:hypothetical protein